MLFSNRERADQDRLHPGESQFAFLDRSGWPEAERVRALLDEWLAEFPEPDQEELRPRLQTDNDISFMSAFSEMYFHAFMKRVGYELDVHPAPPSGTDKRPDFRVFRSDGVEFYLEVVFATDVSAEDAGAQARKDVVLDMLNGLESPNFFLELRLRGAPSTPPPARKLCRSLEGWLRGLDPDVISNNYDKEGSASLPKYPFSHDGWCIDIGAVPKNPKHRGRPGSQSICAQMNAVQVVTPQVSVRDSVEKKATRYGEFGVPYVVAVNLGTRFADHHTYDDALLGTPGIARVDGAVRDIRVRDGAWNGPKGPQNTRVSAVWGVNALDPWTSARMDACVYHNPWAAHPLDGDPIPVAFGQVSEGRFVVRPRSHPRQILGLSEEWPD